MKHTPGPWHVDSVGRIRDDQGTVVHDLSYTREYMDSHVRAANARLMAAAPELYAALRELHDWTRERMAAIETRDMLLRSHAALVKAEGV